MWFFFFFKKTAVFQRCGVLFFYSLDQEDQYVESVICFQVGLLFWESWHCQVAELAEQRMIYSVRGGGGGGTNQAPKKSIRKNPLKNKQNPKLPKDKQNKNKQTPKILNNNKK